MEIIGQHIGAGPARKRHRCTAVSVEVTENRTDTRFCSFTSNKLLRLNQATLRSQSTHLRCIICAINSELTRTVGGQCEACCTAERRLQNNSGGARATAGTAFFRRSCRSQSCQTTVISAETFEYYFGACPQNESCVVLQSTKTTKNFDAELKRL